MHIPDLYELFLQSSGISTDSRTVEKGQLFFALRGPNFNGNQYALQALEKGALKAIVDDPDLPGHQDLILVEDALKTLQDLATYHREELQIPVIGLTGSNGKTTTKELLKAALSCDFECFATRGNLNNHIGVPLSLLEIHEGYEIAIIEMGANKVGDIAFLADIAMPDYGLITNIGKAHLEGFGGIRGVQKGKGELFDFVKEQDGIIFVNTTQPMIVELAADYPRQIRFGRSQQNDFRYEVLEHRETASIRFEIEDYEYTLSSSLVGTFNAENIAAAICIGQHFGIDAEDMVKAVERYQPDNNRSERKKVGSNYFIMDAYNANPTSMLGAIEHFKHSRADNKVLIIGDMLEMGEFSREEHESILEEVSKANFSQVILVGPEFRKADFENRFTHFENVQELKSWFDRQQFRNTHFLLKASRKISLEKLLEQE